MGKSSDTIRQGRISSLNYETGRARVVYEDKNNAVTQELPLLTFEYDMPRVGDQVYVAHQSNGVENGIVISRYWRDDEMPVEYGPHIWRKELRDDAGSFIKFDRNSHTLFIDVQSSSNVSVDIQAAKDVSITTQGNIILKASKIIIDGNIEQKGNIDSDGKVTAIQGEFGQPGETIIATTHRHKGVTTGTSDTNSPRLPS